MAIKKAVDFGIGVCVVGVILSYSAQKLFRAQAADLPGRYVYFASRGGDPVGKDYPEYVDYLKADRHPSKNRVPELISVLQADSTTQSFAKPETRRAILELGNLGEVAAPAAPVLLGLLNKPAAISTSELPYALLHIGPSVAAGFKEVLPNLEGAGFESAATIIQWLGPAGKDVAGYLAPALKEHGRIAWKSAVLIGLSPEPSTEAISVLAAYIDDHNTPMGERQISICVLEKIGVNAQPAVPALIRALDEKPLATNAAAALDKIGAQEGISKARRVFRKSRILVAVWPIIRFLSFWSWAPLVPLLLCRCVITVCDPASSGWGFGRVTSGLVLLCAVFLVAAAIYTPIPVRYDLRLTGRVVDESGGPIPGALVGSELVQRCGSLGGGSTSDPIAKFKTTTDANGHFEQDVRGLYFGYASLLTISGCTPVENRYACKTGYVPTYDFHYLDNKPMPHKGSVDVNFVLKSPAQKEGISTSIHSDECGSR